VGAAAAMAAHGPVAAAGHLAAGLVWVARHGWDSFLAIRGDRTGSRKGLWGPAGGPSWPGAGGDVTRLL
jgi:hypothetical protein